MNTIMKKENLFIRVLIGFVIGAIIGIFAPQFAIQTKVVGDIYLKLIKMMIIPILICAVAGGIINISDTSSLKRIGLKTVGLYIILFLGSAVVSFAVAFAIRPGMGISFTNQPVWEGELADTTVSGFLNTIFPSNIFQSMANGEILPTIIFTALMAVAIVAVGEKGEPLKKWFNSLSAIMFKILSYVMEVSPIGVMSLIAFSLAEYGLGVFSALGKYIICCWLACIAVFILILILPVVLITKVNLRVLLRTCGKIALMTMSTTSSAATLPTTIRLSIDELGAPEGISNFTLPLGCTINMCGGACSFCCLAIFVSDFYNLALPVSTLIGMAMVATVINMAAPGIPGGGIVLGASFLSIFGLPFDLMGPISAFYRLLDMAFTTINVEGDVTANLLISYSEKQWNRDMVKGN
ncbi:MAG: dicarboxylate/amino acid:cation symporter [Tissierellia bacterium]|nr:dicarboxylate/amino acid:cation symporter [Tissierellia bacterium]